MTDPANDLGLKFTGMIVAIGNVREWRDTKRDKLLYLRSIELSDGTNTYTFGEAVENVGDLPKYAVLSKVRIKVESASSDKGSMKLRGTLTLI